MIAMELEKHVKPSLNHMKGEDHYIVLMLFFSKTSVIHFRNNQGIRDKLKAKIFTDHTVRSNTSISKPILLLQKGRDFFSWPNLYWNKAIMLACNNYEAWIDTIEKNLQMQTILFSAKVK